MSRRTYDVQGFTLCLDHVVMVSSIFEAENGEGYQFNVRLTGDVRLAIKRPTQHDATLERQLFIRALKDDEITAGSGQGTLQG